MTTVQISDTVGAIVRDYPSLSRLFEEAQVDYCCGGQKTLLEACAQRGIDPQAFLLQLEAYPETQARLEANLSNLTLIELADHIKQTHHAYLHTELPRLAKMVTKVAAVHGDKDSRLATLRDVFLGLSQELIPHLIKEEQVLFPMIQQLAPSSARAAFHCGAIANTVHQMELEHQECGVALTQLRQLTDGYSPPDWACNTYRALLDALLSLEQDMHQHIHKENNVLFPRAIVLEQNKVSQ